MRVASDWIQDKIVLARRVLESASRPTREPSIKYGGQIVDDAARRAPTADYERTELCVLAQDRSVHHQRRRNSEAEAAAGNDHSRSCR